MTDIEIPEGFTRWDGNKNLRVEILLDNGSRVTVPVRWLDNGRASLPGYDIIAYRIVSDA